MVEFDEKGRLLIPKKMRRLLGRKVTLKAKGKNIVITPVTRNPIEVLASLQVKTKKTPVQMKREAEEVFDAALS